LDLAYLLAEEDSNTIYPSQLLVAISSNTMLAVLDTVQY